MEGSGRQAVETTAANTSFAEPGRTSRLVRGLGLAIAVGAGYFLIDWLALSLWIEPYKESVFSFTPGGFAAGLLIALGPRARWPVSAGVGVAAYAALVLLSEARPIGINVAYAIGDIVQVLIIAGLIDHFFGRGFRLERLRHVLGLVAAAAVSCAICSAGWTLFIILFYIPEGKILIFFQHLFLNTLSGVVSVAPLVIGIGAALRRPPPMGEFLEAAVAIGALAVMTGAVVALPAGLWGTVVPAALLFPILVWLAVRCYPVFAAAGVFLASMTIIWTTTYRIGHFGETVLSIEDRIVQAQTIIMFVAVGTCVLAALFAERKESEGRLTQSNILLERERDNKLMNVQAALSAVAHEVRQPLGGITLEARIALGSLAMTPPDYDDVRVALERISEGGRRADDVLNGVQALFKKHDGGKQRIDMNEIILGVLRSMEAQFKNRDVVTRVELASDLPLLHGHGGQLQELVSNLVINAMEAMDSTVGRNRELHVRSELRGPDAVGVTVEDSGPGISQQDLAGIFNAFVTTKRHGTGLGLAISQSIVERHGGHISASSDGKSGARFDFELPVR
ncbi:MAG TPA: ATP-binding protein [Xanthobacteraceae bacterium]|jgi:signal transduction histidine kinase|nr:ATP-binding protein [Xanthobacteraceae bacterium]